MADFQEMHIALSDGYRAYARYWPVVKCRAAALHIHGIQSHCGWYTETVRAMQNAGIAVLQPDRRGSGRNTERRGHAESAPQLIDDAVVCARKLCSLTGMDKVHLIGVSWGGKLIAAVHATEPTLAAGLSPLAPGIFPIVSVPTAEKFKIGLSMLSSPEKLYDIPLNDPELFTADPKCIEFLENDELQIHQATAGFYLASRRMDKIVAKLGGAPPVPINVFLAGEERIIDNERTREFLRDLPWPCRHLTCYEESRHTFEFGPARDQFVEDLTRWVLDPQTYAASVTA